MRVTGLRRAHGLLVVQARIWGPLANDSVSLALDTAATETLVKPDVLRRFGYRDEDAVRRTTITSAIGVEPGHLLVVERFAALGFAVSAHLVHAHELPDQYDIDGLLAALPRPVRLHHPLAPQRNRRRASQHSQHLKADTGADS